MSEETFFEAISIVWIVLFALFCLVLITTVVLVSWWFRKKTKHRDYLLFFGFTLLGATFLIMDRIILDHVGLYTYPLWFFYFLGQNLLVTSETIRAGRLCIIYYGSFEFFPPRRILPSRINGRSLTTKRMLIVQGILQLPVLVFYAALCITENEVWDIWTVCYFGIELLCLIIFTLMLYFKRNDLKKYQLEENMVMLVFAFILTIYILSDNIRWYIIPEDVGTGYGATVGWELTDLLTMLSYAIISVGIWYRHISIMWNRNFNQKGAAYPENGNLTALQEASAVDFGSAAQIVGTLPTTMAQVDCNPKEKENVYNTAEIAGSADDVNDLSIDPIEEHTLAYIPAANDIVDEILRLQQVNKDLHAKLLLLTGEYSNANVDHINDILAKTNARLSSRKSGALADIGESRSLQKLTMEHVVLMNALRRVGNPHIKEKADPFLE